MSRREFDRKTKAAAFLRADGHCEKCRARLQTGRFHYDHVIPDALGGEPVLSNCEVLCEACHGEKTASGDVPRIAKMKRQRDRHIGALTPSKKPMPFGRQSEFKRKLDGSIVRRTKR